MTDTLRARAEQWLRALMALWSKPGAWGDPQADSVDAILAAFEDVTRELREQHAAAHRDWQVQTGTLERAITQGAREQRRLEQAVETERRSCVAAEQALRDHVTLLVWEMDHGNAESAREVVLRIERLLAATRPTGAATP